MAGIASNLKTDRQTDRQVLSSLSGPQNLQFLFFLKFMYCLFSYVTETDVSLVVRKRAQVSSFVCSVNEFYLPDVLPRRSSNTHGDFIQNEVE